MTQTAVLAIDQIHRLLRMAASGACTRQVVDASGCVWRSSARPITTSAGGVR
jgi:hypothetical protein